MCTKLLDIFVLCFLGALFVAELMNSVFCGCGTNWPTFMASQTSHSWQAGYLCVCVCMVRRGSGQGQGSTHPEVILQSLMLGMLCRRDRGLAQGCR